MRSRAAIEPDASTTKITRLPSRPSRTARRTSSGRGRSGPAAGDRSAAAEQGGEQVQSVPWHRRRWPTPTAAEPVAGPRTSARRALTDPGDGQRAGAKGFRRRRAGPRRLRSLRVANSVVAEQLFRTSIDWPPPGGSGSGSGSGSPTGLSQRLVELVRGRCPGSSNGSRRRRCGNASSAATRMSCCSTVRAPRQAACATAVRATTRSARIPSTSNAAQSAAIRRNSLSGNTTSSTSARAAAIRRASSASALGVAFGEHVRVGLVGHPLPDDLHTHVDVARRVHVDGEAEPVQQLRSQFALLRVHRADEHEPGFVRMRDAVAFHMHPSHRGGVEQHVDQMIVQQVDLVDVEDAAVGAGQQSGRKCVLAITQHPLQIQRPDHPVFGGAQRHLDQACTGISRIATGRGGEQRGQTAHGRRLGGALLAADQRTADFRTHGAQQQRETHLFVAHDRAERIGLHGLPARPEPGRSIGTCGMPSSTKSSPSRTNPCWAYMSARYVCASIRHG